MTNESIIATLYLAYDNASEPLYRHIKDVIETQYPNIKFWGYNESKRTERTKAFKIKGGYSARQTPFAVIVDCDNDPVRAFYSEANECVVDNVLQFVDHFIESKQKTLMLLPVVKVTTNDLPQYETTASAGCDLRAELTLVKEKFLFDAEITACTDDGPAEITIQPGGRALIPTGMSIALPEGYEAQIRPRSGLALKNGVTVLNSPGTIDSDYRGDVGVVLINQGFEPFVVKQGDRIAQMVVTTFEQVEFVTVSDLDETTRGAGGFGSTGSN